MITRLLAASAVLVSAPASAVSVIGIATSGDNEAAVATAALGLLEVDLVIGSFRPTVFTLAPDAAGEAFDFNATVAVFTGLTTGQGLKTLTLKLDGATFEAPGTVEPAFSSVRTRLDGQLLRLTFSGEGEFFGLDLGNVAGTGSNFRLAFEPNAAQATLTVRALAVPEAGAWAMMIAGFGLVGGAMRRRRVTAAS